LFVVDFSEHRRFARYTSFPGLQVLEDAEILAGVKAANITASFAPVAFEGGSYRACVREICKFVKIGQFSTTFFKLSPIDGPKDHDTPLEYTWQPADQSIILNRFDAKVFGSYWPML
jgi:hypothetical protein